MKKQLRILLTLTLAVLLAGCPQREKAAQSSVNFYYPRQEVAFAYQSSDGVIRSEAREVYGHEQDLTHLLRLYLEGPEDGTLASPFPKDTRLLTASRKDDTLTVKLSAAFAGLQGIDLTIACACLTATCLELTDAEAVTIISEQITVTMNRGSLTLLDDTAPGASVPE